MKKIITYICLLLITQQLQSQNLSSQIIDGAKTLVDVVRVFKPTNSTQYSAPSTDAIFKNRTDLTTEVQLLKKKTDSIYSSIPVKLIIAAGSAESYLDISPGIYRYKVFRKSTNTNTEIIKEGEFRIETNEKKIIYIEK
jgi:hypothetical protein